MKKVLLMCQQYGCPLELSPARYQLIHEMKCRGYEIHVFFPGMLLENSIKKEIDYFINTTNYSTKELRKKIKNGSYYYIISFTYEDACILYKIQHEMKKTHFIYFNLEIYTPSMEEYIQPHGKYFKIRCFGTYLCNKIKEMIFARNCELFIIQDKLRKNTSKKYGVSHPNTLLIPNSYIYNEIIPNNERKGIVYAGGMNRLQLGSLFQNIDKLQEIPITFAGWCDDWFVQQFKKIENKNRNIKLKKQKLKPDELSDYLNQYAIGLIWYSPTKDENINNIGLASGKLFKHLSLGQPVIVFDCPGISRVIRKYNLGIVINNISEIEDAYEKISVEYERYSNNVKRVYKDKFDYSKIIQRFFEQLEKMEV